MTTTRPPFLRLFPDKLVVDNFAGGGGASTGIRAAIGRDPDMRRRQRCAVPASDASAWEALGWRTLGEVPVGRRGEGPHVLIEWEGEGEPPTPEGGQDARRGEV